MAITLRDWATLAFCAEVGIQHDMLASACATHAGIGGHGQMDPMLYDLYTGINWLRLQLRKPEVLVDLFFRANRNRLREFLMKGVDVSSPVLRPVGTAS